MDRHSRVLALPFSPRAARGEPWRRVPWPGLLRSLGILLLAGSLADLGWLAFSPRPGAAPASLPAARDTDVAAILSAELFGPSPEAWAPAGEAAPVSGLNLILAGVVAGGGGGRDNPGGIALIGADGQPPQPFTAGQEIVPGVTLERVYPEKALIRRAGVSEVLLLAGATAPLAAAAPAAPAGVVPVPAGKAPARSEAVRELRPNHFSVSRDLVQEQLRSSDLLQQARMRPSETGGFLIDEVKAGSLYEKLGLRPGHVIRSVNGRPIQSVDDVLAIYRELGGGGRLQLDVAQGARLQRLYYDVR